MQEKLHTVFLQRFYYSTFLIDHHSAQDSKNNKEPGTRKPSPYTHACLDPSSRFLFLTWAAEKVTAVFYMNTQAGKFVFLVLPYNLRSN